MDTDTLVFSPYVIESWYIL